MDEKMQLQEEQEEYVVFSTTNKEGEKIEMAVIDEFEFEGGNYVAAALVEGDTIQGDDLYIYQIRFKGGEKFEVEKISSSEEYSRIAEAYMELQ